MTEQVILIAIGLVVAGFVLRPLLRRSPSRPSGPASRVPAVHADEMSELELDREMGRVSEEDYQKWRAEIEGAGPGPAIDMQVDRKESLARAEALVKRWRDEPRSVCPRCGVRPEAAARFCSNCGAPLAS